MKHPACDAVRNGFEMHSVTSLNCKFNAVIISNLTRQLRSKTMHNFYELETDN